jgi:protein O-mannosyl-transferase
MDCPVYQSNRVTKNLEHTVQPWKQAICLAAITLAVFWPTLSAQFVYDARLQILTGDFIHDPGNWVPVLSGQVLAMDVLDFNRPVQLASLMLDAAVWGRDAFGYHLTSVLLHALNVVMVWGIARGLSRAGERQAEGLSYNVIAALLFAVHPIVTEAVCEPTFREDLLVAACTLGALLLAMRHDSAAPNGDRWRALGCAGLCFLAVASKESGIAAPGVLAVYWWVQRSILSAYASGFSGHPLGSRLGLPGHSAYASGFRNAPPTEARGVSRRDGSSFWPTAIGGGKAAAIAFLAARFLLEPAQSAIFEAKPQYPGESFWAAMAIEPRILALYAQLVAFPVNLCADYGLYSVRHLPLPVAVVILAGLVAAAVVAIRADRRMALACAIIVLPLIPVSNLFPIYRAAADRYMYLPMAGVALAVGWLLDGPWLAARPRLREKATIACMAAVVLLGMACVERQKVWANPLALWEDTFRKNPVAYTAASGLADSLREAGRLPEAERATREAIRLSDGKRGDPWVTLALILDAQGREADAFEAAGKALEVQPSLGDPEARVRVLAMERQMADEWGRLLARRPK